MKLQKWRPQLTASSVWSVQRIDSEKADVDALVASALKATGIIKA